MTFPAFSLSQPVINHYPSFSRLSGGACFDDTTGATQSEQAINEITRRPGRHGPALNTTSTQPKLEDGTVVREIFFFSTLTRVYMLANEKLVTPSMPTAPSSP